MLSNICDSLYVRDLRQPALSVNCDATQTLTISGVQPVSALTNLFSFADCENEFRKTPVFVIFQL